MNNMKVGSLFAGIGGLDFGFEQHGHTIEFFSENDDSAVRVLKAHFPETEMFGDIKELRSIPKVDILTAGFPCQDISLAGTRHGLQGHRSGLINEVFRLVKKSKPEFIVLENVLNLLRLEKGAALVSILLDLEKLGYNWAYRVIDTRGFGLPQRRMRVVILATNANHNAGRILFADSVSPIFDDVMRDLKRKNNYGFYWTEGKRGVGWATNAVPTIKGGSGLGIPSAPAIFSGARRLAGTIHIDDAERLQGFPAGWTNVSEIGRIGNRWKLVGNAVSVPLSNWLGGRFKNIDKGEIAIQAIPMDINPPLSMAAYGSAGKWFKVEASTHVLLTEHQPIGEFLENPIRPLSGRALTGYISRTKAGDKHFPAGFVKALEVQLKRQGKQDIEPIFLS